MPDSPAPPTRESDERKRLPFQFSLREMLLLMTAVAVVLGLWAAFPAVLAIGAATIAFACVPLALAVAVTVAIYARGFYQAVAIGAVVGVICCLLFSVVFGATFVFLVIFWLTGTFVGAAAGGGAYRLVKTRGWDQSD